MRKIILDTDIGCDIDDAFALAYLLSRDDIEILGITTVSGLPELRAQLADNICSTYGKDIPIYAGNEKSLSNEIRQPKLTKAQTIVANANRRCFSKDNIAVEFMKSAIEKLPGEITLVCIGQLTNVATLFMKYPHIPELLKEIVIMGGRYAENEYCDTKKWGKTEWNILCDIKAAEIVFEANVKNCFVMGIEQTCKFHLSPQSIKNAFNLEEKFKAVADCISTKVEQVYFHDIITVYAWLFQNDVKCIKGEIDIVYVNDYVKTTFSPNENGKHCLVTDFSAEKFFNNYIDTVKINFVNMNAN